MSSKNVSEEGECEQRTEPHVAKCISDEGVRVGAKSNQSNGGDQSLNEKKKKKKIRKKLIVNIAK